MELDFFQVDAFADRPLTGNPAAVMPLAAWLPEATMQAIAAENNLSETAFTVPAAPGGEADYELRWFTPQREVALCGHATLAAAHVLMGASDRLRFATRSGVLTVVRDGAGQALDLPAASVVAAPVPGLAAALRLGGESATFVASGGNGGVIAVLDSEAAVRAVKPDFAALAAFEGLVMVTAPGDRCDVASRVFAPAFGIDEDPVTGSAHAALVPLWVAKLRKTTLDMVQASARGGSLTGRLAGDRVVLTGKSFAVISGKFRLD